VYIGVRAAKRSTNVHPVYRRYSIMETRFESKWANRAAQAAITLGAVMLFFVMRPDIGGYLSDHVLAKYQQKVATPKIIAEYMRRTPRPKVQIGAGTSNEPGWLNTDIEPNEDQAYVDATKPLPFPDGSVYYIFAEHVIEHLSYAEALGFFKEAHRVLAPGGKIRMVTPNLKKFVALFDEPDPEHSAKLGNFVARKLEWFDWAKTADPACLILNNEMHSFGDQFLYTPALLRASYQQAGFTDIRQYAAGETSDPAFGSVEGRPRSDYKDVNAYEAMAIEATR
jgi:SAM-dependent methyltransferase